MMPTRLSLSHDRCHRASGWRRLSEGADGNLPKARAHGRAVGVASLWGSSYKVSQRWLTGRKKRGSCLVQVWQVVGARSPIATMLRGLRGCRPDFTFSPGRAVSLLSEFQTGQFSALSRSIALFWLLQSWLCTVPGCLPASFLTTPVPVSCARCGLFILVRSADGSGATAPSLPALCTPFLVSLPIPGPPSPSSQCL